MSENGEIKEPVLTREQLEANIQISKEWIDALKLGNYPGEIIFKITTLMDFLTHQNKIATDNFEKACFIHPDWKVQNKPVEAVQ